MLIVDIDECESLDLNNCKNKEICVNTLGGYICNCRPGYSAHTIGSGESECKGM